MRQYIEEELGRSESKLKLSYYKLLAQVFIPIVVMAIIIAVFISVLNIRILI